jgi:hypothetical protein
MLGMYVHTHWSYNHPYCARRWTDEDWRGYLSALREIGYDTVMIWPQLDTMPVPRTPSDDAYLARLAGVIDFAHSLQMKVLLTLTANVVAGPKASQYTFETRNYWEAEDKANPTDPADVRRLIEARRLHLQPLAKADGVSIIDSDPGGWPDSPTEHFVDLFVAQARVMRQLNHNAEIWYWAWFGWPHGQRMGTYLDTFDLLDRKADFPWLLLSCFDVHLEASMQRGLTERRAFYPYAMVEFEPSFPMVNCRPNWFRQEMQRFDPAVYPLGLIVNSQTHCLQAPYAYLTAHYARGGTRATERLGMLGEWLVPEAATLIGESLARLEELPEVEEMRHCARQLRAAAEKNPVGGRLVGLIFGSPRRFLIDLADNLDLRADFLELRRAVDTGRHLKPVLRTLVSHIRPYQQRVGYDAAFHMEPLRPNLILPLQRIGDETLNKAIASQGGERGYLPALFDAIDAFAAE